MASTMNSTDPALDGINLDDDFPDISLNDILRFRDFCKLYPSLAGTESAMRATIFKSSTNGLDDCGAILRLGKTVFVVVPRIKAWYLSHAPQRIQHPLASLKPARGNESRACNAKAQQPGGRRDGG